MTVQVRTIEFVSVDCWHVTGRQWIEGLGAIEESAVEFDMDHAPDFEVLDLLELDQGRKTPPVWSEQDAAYYRRGMKYGGEDLGVCSLCKTPMRIGDPYWLDRAKMVVEPNPVFHARCQGKGEKLAAERN